MNAARWTSGWRRSALAFTLGVCATAALPPFFLFPMLIPAFAGLLWLVANAPSGRRAAWDGWWWGLGHFTTGLYWFCIALLTDPEKFAWLIPFTLIGLNGLFALFPAFATFIFYRLRTRGLMVPLMFAVIWTLVEYLRGHILTGFPWNLAGYAFAITDASAQGAAYIGAYGLTFVAVLAACAPALWRAPRGRAFTLACWFGIGLMTAGGAWRLSHAQVDFVEGVKLRLVQANIAQHHKWDPARQMQAIDTYIRLSRAPGYNDITHIIWPETAVPFVLDSGSPLLPLLRNVAPPQGALLTGTLRSEGEGEDWQIWNSMIAITRGQGIATSYDKHHLVPFGEFVPLRGLLPVEKITPGQKDFSRGPGPATLTLPGAPPVSPLICYEVIFPGEVIARSAPPEWMLNITNDAWFGNSTGPYQHFHMARMRAIEEGIPLVRAANTGISAVIDSYGRTVAVLPLGVQGYLDSPLPRVIRE